VRRAIAEGCELEDLPLAVRQELFPELADRLQKELRVDRVLGRRRAIGGTAPSRVRAEIKTWKRRLERKRT